MTDISIIIDVNTLIIKCQPVRVPLVNSKNIPISMKARIIAIICVTVFNFPQIDAAITCPPLPTATSLYPETTNSLNKTIIGIHPGIFPCSTSIIKAAKTRILSAIGSKNLPNVVIKFLFLIIVFWKFY